MGAFRRPSLIGSHQLDRVAFTAYFLGAVVPLVALAVVVERYVLPTLSDGNVTAAMIGAVASIAVLSLGSFLTLRLTTRQSLKQMDMDNARLASLLRVSGSLASAQHGSDAAATAARCALELAGASAAFVMVRGEGEGRPVMLEAAGADARKLAQSLSEPLTEMASQVIGEGRPAIRAPEDRASADTCPRLEAAAAVPLPGEKAALGALAVIRTEPGAGFDAAQLDSLSTLAGLAAVALRNADLRHAQRNFFSHVTEILVTALDAHLGYHSGHGNRVAQYANRIGREMGLDDDRMQRLHFASLLHDIGLLKLDRTLQKNPKVCQKHSVLGYRMLDRIRLWQDIAPIVHHHHERFDGTGYPEGLAGEDIPLESRIIGLCEAFDTVTSNTSYKVAMPFEDAVNEIEEGSGTQFDPSVVTAFRNLVDRGVIDTDSINSR